MRKDGNAGQTKCMPGPASAHLQDEGLAGSQCTWGCGRQFPQTQRQLCPVLLRDATSVTY